MLTGNKSYKTKPTALAYAFLMGPMSYKKKKQQDTKEPPSGGSRKSISGYSILEIASDATDIFEQFCAELAIMDMHIVRRFMSYTGGKPSLVLEIR
jgi:hypothetical protein